jgi:RimJ/RimL family protein N-acetyltransferase/ABC-type transporter Mla MlaB component
MGAVYLDDLSVLTIPAAHALDRGELHAEIWLGRSLTARVAAPLCEAVTARIREGAAVLELHMPEVQRIDCLGLAALHQVGALTRARGVILTLTASPALHRALLDAQLLEEFTLAAPRSVPRTPNVRLVEDTASDLVIATSRNVALRLPTAEDLPRFADWARDPLLTHMVGSDLLYRCRHLGPRHPEVAALILDNPSSLTALVSPLAAPGEPVGFVRLYSIRLASGLAFLETAVASAHACRRGWGVEASRLLLAYAMDTLGVHRVEAKAFGYNTRSINALNRNNFQQEGVLRDARLCDGRRSDILVFSILEDEMRHQRQREQYPYMGFWEQPP